MGTFIFPRILKFKGKTGWDSTLPTISSCYLEDTLWAANFKEGAIKPLQSAVFYNCPKCNKVESSQRGSFQRVDLDVKHRCGFCRKATAVKSWTCQCGPQWHSCVQHRGAYLLMPLGEPIIANFMNGLPSTFTFPSIRPALKKRPSRITGGILAKQKRCRITVTKGEKRMGDIILSDSQRLLKRPACLGPVFSGVKGNGGASSRPSA